MLQISRIGIIHRIKPPAVWSITLTTHFLSHPEGIANHTDTVNRLDDCLEPCAGAQITTYSPTAMMTVV